MNWFTKLFAEDKTPATEESKKLLISKLHECELFYCNFDKSPEYLHYAKTFREIQEDSLLLQELTQVNIERLLRLFNRPYGFVMNYPGAEKLAIQYMLIKEREANVNK